MRIEDGGDPRSMRGEGRGTSPAALIIVPARPGWRSPRGIRVPRRRKGMWSVGLLSRPRFSSWELCSMNESKSKKTAPLHDGFEWAGAVARVRRGVRSNRGAPHGALEHAHRCLRQLQPRRSDQRPNRGRALSVRTAIGPRSAPSRLSRRGTRERDTQRTTSPAGRRGGSGPVRFPGLDGRIHRPQRLRDTEIRRRISGGSFSVSRWFISRRPVGRTGPLRLRRTRPGRCSSSSPWGRAPAS